MVAHTCNPTLRKLRQEEYHEFNAILDYVSKKLNKPKQTKPNHQNKTKTNTGGTKSRKGKRGKLQSGIPLWGQMLSPYLSLLINTRRFTFYSFYKFFTDLQYLYIFMRYDTMF